MATLLAQIAAPQRSTQYSSLAGLLAPYEIELSPLGAQLNSIEPIDIGGQQYLKCDLDGELVEEQRQKLGLLAMTGAYFLY
jgi:hypothetical protein